MIIKGSFQLPAGKVFICLGFFKFKKLLSIDVRIFLCRKRQQKTIVTQAGWSRDRVTLDASADLSCRKVTILAVQMVSASSTFYKHHN